MSCILPKAASYPRARWKAGLLGCCDQRASRLESESSHRLVGKQAIKKAIPKKVKKVFTGYLVKPIKKKQYLENRYFLRSLRYEGYSWA